MKTKNNLAAPDTGTFYTVLALWLVAACTAVNYGSTLAGTGLAPDPRQAIGKALLCALLLAATACATYRPRRERLGLGLGLLAAMVGDVVLALPLKWSLIGGLGAFFITHLAYCMVLAPLRGQPRLWQRRARPLPWLAASVLYVLFWPRLHELTVPVALYIVALCAMASLALSARHARLWLGAGAALFVASDAMLGIERFLTAFPGSTPAIWFAYAAAQLCLVAGLLRRPD
ncbi:lysoplasmalogenase [Paraburkholderia hayleyella]|uniref:lysoplasmalogenase n=1 Tax=Paraburkholderia hayleyella TaxID=2152889 RepID=UPI0012914765|nr:lysoplasmalogenase [Paraburkholderia hayleyella]